MNDSQLLDLIRCPVDGQSLLKASNEIVAALNGMVVKGELRDASDGIVQEPLEGALITTDGARLHAIRGGIPTLIPGEAIPLPASIQHLYSPAKTVH
jgi:uncharacterized protein